MKGSQIVFKWLVLAFCTVSFVYCLTDQTREDSAAGKDVVEAVIDVLRLSCIFEDDLVRLRAKAASDTNDGTDPHTYMMSYQGGIWHITPANLTRTQTDPDLESYRQDISRRLFINWTTVTYNDLRKPLISALASQLLITLTNQGSFGLPNANRRTSAELEAFQQRIASSLLHHNLDIVFVLDSSASVSAANFSKSKEFVKNCVSLLNVDSGLVRVAVVPYSTVVQHSILLNNNMNSAALQDAISKIAHTPGGTSTGLALSYVNNTVFQVTAGSRPNSAKVVVLVTDGRSDDSSQTRTLARALKDSGVTIFAYGVGNIVDRNELLDVVSQPSCVYLHTVDSYSDLTRDIFNTAIQFTKAPVSLKPGVYTFDCATDARTVFMATLHPTTVEISVNDGVLGFFGTVSEQYYPNPALHSFNGIASNQIPANIYIRDGERIQLTFRNFSCRSNFRINIKFGDHLHVDAHTICIQNSVIGDCSAKDLVSSPFIFTAAPEPSLAGLCVGTGISIFSHPTMSDRYLICDNGELTVISCYPGEKFDPVAKLCLRVSGTQPITSTEGPVIQPIAPQTVINPCTQEHILQGLNIFPFPGNDQFYIKCGFFLSEGVIENCGSHKYFSASIHNCLFRDVVLPGHQFATFDNPCKLNYPNQEKYYPYPGDPHKFIQCDAFGDGFERDCSIAGEVWVQQIFQCTPPGFVYWTLATQPIPVG